MVALQENTVIYLATAREEHGDPVAHLAVMTKQKGSNNKRTSRRSSSEVKKLILESARTEFAKRGYAETGSRDIAHTAGVAVSVLYRHFDSKADLFSAAVLEPFVQAFDKLGNDWIQQLGDPLPDEQLMQVFLHDIYSQLLEHQRALNQLLLNRGELDAEMLARIRDVFAQLFARQTVMTQLEVNRRPWMAKDNIDVSLRMLMSMLLGVSTYGWMLLPEGEQHTSSKTLLDAMVRFGLFGMAEPPASVTKNKTKNSR